VRTFFCCLLSAVFCLLLAAPAAAQQKDPLPPFAVDLRGIFARHKSEPSTATELGVAAGNLPTRSFGLVGGGHLYVLRGRKIAFGIGGTMLVGGGHKSIELPPPPGSSTGSGTVMTSPTVRRHFRSIDPEFSLNFGHRNGWSYISGGFLGRSKMYLDTENTPATAAPQRRTLTYGAGARWFTNDHLAFSVEVRWYSIAEQPADAASHFVLEPRTTLMVLSGGISIK
jgi:hypothetical protein